MHFPAGSFRTIDNFTKTFACISDIFPGEYWSGHSLTSIMPSDRTVQQPLCGPVYFSVGVEFGQALPFPMALINMDNNILKYSAILDQSEVRASTLANVCHCGSLFISYDQPVISCYFFHRPLNTVGLHTNNPCHSSPRTRVIPDLEHAFLSSITALINYDD